MKTVITATSNDVNSTFDKRFGRGAWFCVYNDETGETSFTENVNVNANNGAGTSASALMAKLGAKKVISGHFGPKAKEVLEELGIQMVIFQEDNLTVQDIINKLK